MNLQDTLAKIDVPVIAAGGICNGKGLLAALSMGAEGVLMATAFMATVECPIHDNIKTWIQKSKITDTMIAQRSIRNPIRCIKNNYAHMILGYESRGANIETLLPFIKGEIGKKALQDGEIDGAIITLGQCVGLIDRIMTCKELIEGMVIDAKRELDRTNRIFV